jgi:hypothetical protein
LWDVRSALGASLTEELVVAAMKLTPCHPDLLDAREALLSADVNLDGGANRCALYDAFAARGMGVDASSPNDTSTSSIHTSFDVPSECRVRTFRATDLPLAIPDHDRAGAHSVVLVDRRRLDVQKVVVNAHITHPYRGDLVVQLLAPNGQYATLAWALFPGELSAGSGVDAPTR